jgi:hypothetical protein
MEDLIDSGRFIKNIRENGFDVSGQANANHFHRSLGACQTHCELQVLPKLSL